MDSERREPDDAFPTWDAATVDELRDYGDERAVAAGEVLLEAGRRPEGFFVVLDGEVEVVQPDGPGAPAALGHAGPRVGAVGPGQFVGAVSLLTGQRPYLTVRAARPSRVRTQMPQPAAHS